MAIVKLVSGRIVENARLTDVQSVGDEGARRATAHIDGHAYPVYNTIIDGFDPVWYEQMDWETYKSLGKGGFVEGSAESVPDVSALLQTDTRTIREEEEL